MVGSNYVVYASAILGIGYIILSILYDQTFAEEVLFSFESLFIVFLPVFISLLTEVYYGFIMGDDKEENTKLRNTLSKYAFTSFIIIILIDLFVLKK